MEQGKIVKKLVKPSTAGMTLATRLGKIPPQAIELEEAVLGALMLERSAIELVREILVSESFYMDAHKLLYAGILALWKKKEPIDILTVTNELRKQGKLEFVGGAYYISELTNRVGSAANVDYHARIIAQKYILRQIIEVAGTLAEEAYEDTTDVFDLSDRAVMLMQKAVEVKYVKQEQRFADVVDEIRNESDIVEEVDNSGVPTGFGIHDQRCGRFLPGELIVVAARPGMGKTSWALDVAYNAVTRFNKPVGIFSLEMPNKQLTARILSHDLRIPVADIINKRMTPGNWGEVDLKMKKFRDMELYLNDEAELTVTDLRSKIRKLVSKYGVQEIIIDYLQLMDGVQERKYKDNREQEISSITRTLKKYAKEFGIPIIALSQLSRKVEERKDKRPMLSDLRESGSIEQDSDRVIFLYRPEEYSKQHVILEGQKIAPFGVAELIVAKNRNGGKGTTPLYFDAPYTHFTDWVWGVSDRMLEKYSENNLRDAGERIRKDKDDDLPF